MALANNSPVNARAIRDLNFIANIALPNAGNTVNTAALNLQNATPYPTTAKVVTQVVTTAGNGANNKNITVVLQHSADDNTSNYVNIPQLTTSLLKVTDANGGGYPVGVTNVILPPDVKQYIRAQATGEANGGNAANGTLTLQLLF